MEIKELAKGLAIFHKEVGTIKKTSKNPFFNSSYAPLTEILSKIEEPLEKAGLVITQCPVGEGELLTLLIHAESGQYLETRFNMNVVKNDPQALGSAITYARRYAIGSILNLNIDEDDDGNKAMPAPPANQSGDKPWLNNSGLAWDKALKYMQEGGDIQKIKDKYKVSKANQELLTK